jgi:hypothetical protein
MTGSCEHGNKFPCSIKDVEWLVQLRNYQLLADSVLWIWFGLAYLRNFYLIAVEVLFVSEFLMPHIVTIFT